MLNWVWYSTIQLYSIELNLENGTNFAVGNGDWNQKSCHESRLNGKVVSFSLHTRFEIEYKSGFILASISNWWWKGYWNQNTCVMNPDWMEKWFHSRFTLVSRLNTKVVSFSLPYQTDDGKGIETKTLVSWIQIEWKSGFILASISNWWWKGYWNQNTCVMNPDWMEKWFHSRFHIKLMMERVLKPKHLCHESRLNGKVVSFSLHTRFETEYKSGFILASLSNFIYSTTLAVGKGYWNQNTCVMNPDWMEKWFHSRFLIPLLYSTT